jgi:hypothetical protein
VIALACLLAFGSFEIRLPDGVRSETVFVAYALDGEGLRRVEPRAGLSSYRIGTGRAGRIRAVMHAPGCAPRTIDFALPALAAYSFECRRGGQVWIEGTIARMDRLYGREVEVHAKHIARWAGMAVAIPVGETAAVAADGRFRLAVPDLPLDSLQIWARDRASGELVARLDRVGPAVWVPCAVNPPRHDDEGFALRPGREDACGP